jgi:hypothetical protein
LVVNDHAFSSPEEQSNAQPVDELADDNAAFSDEFCAFLKSCIATVDAAEVLLLLWRTRPKAWSARELAAKLSPTGTMSEAEAARYLDGLQHGGLTSRDADGRSRYREMAPSGEHVATLARLYIERPVTLFRVIYALRDSKIKTLADAFRIWRK